jgi:hypothetical protein
MAGGGDRFSNAGAALKDQDGIGGEPPRDLSQNGLPRAIPRWQWRETADRPALAADRHGKCSGRHQVLWKRGEQRVGGGGRQR